MLVLFVFLLFFKILLVVGRPINSSFSAATNRPLQFVAHLADWAMQILLYLAGIRDWSSFFQKFRPTLPSIGNLFLIVDVVFMWCMFVIYTDPFLLIFL